jgi:hypothetical protein
MRPPTLAGVMLTDPVCRKTEAQRSATELSATMLLLWVQVTRGAVIAPKICLHILLVSHFITVQFPEIKVHIEHSDMILTWALAGCRLI